MSRWKILLMIAAGVAMSAFFLAIMRPPGGQPSAPGQDLPWQMTVSKDGTHLTVFGLTLGKSTLQDAVNKLGRRYDLGLFQDKAEHLSLEAYFRDAVIGRLNARLVLSAQLPETVLSAIRRHAGNGKPIRHGGRHFSVAEEDTDMALGAVIRTITYMPVVKFDADLVRQRFGEPAERIPSEDGAHWLYPAKGLDLLLGHNGKALLQYVPPAEFDKRLRVPLQKQMDSGEKE